MSRFFLLLEKRKSRWRFTIATCVFAVHVSGLVWYETRTVSVVVLHKADDSFVVRIWACGNFLRLSLFIHPHAYIRCFQSLSSQSDGHTRTFRFYFHASAVLYLHYPFYPRFRNQFQMILTSPCRYTRWRGWVARWLKSASTIRSISSLITYISMSVFRM